MNAFLGLFCGLVVGVAGGWLLRKKYGTRADEIKDKLDGQ